MIHWMGALVVGFAFLGRAAVPTPGDDPPSQRPSDSTGVRPAESMRSQPSHAAASAVCPGTGPCCEANGTPGCENQACCETVCAADPWCCDHEWDELCGDRAIELCDGGLYCMFCPGDGACCEANGTPRCDDEVCCQTVCAQDPYCCSTDWDTQCAGAANALCGAGNYCGACPGQGPCCEANATPGCDDAACCNAVCAQDPVCCVEPWDAACAGLADTACGGGGGGYCSLCPGAGDCCAANGTPGCDDQACCETVCAVDPLCCGVEWDVTCAAEADDLCGGGGFCAFCPGAGDCCIANGSAGCDDQACCETVCAGNAFCCIDVWDATCAAAAQSLCKMCPGSGIPAVSGWGMAAATLLILAAGTVIIARRQAAAPRR